MMESFSFVISSTGLKKCNTGKDNRIVTERKAMNTPFETNGGNIPCLISALTEFLMLIMLRRSHESELYNTRVVNNWNRYERKRL